MVFIKSITFLVFNKFMPDFLQKSKVGHYSISFFTVLFTMYSRACVSVLFQDLELHDPEIFKD